MVNEFGVLMVYSLSFRHIQISSILRTPCAANNTPSPFKATARSLSLQSQSFQVLSILVITKDFSEYFILKPLKTLMDVLTNLANSWWACLTRMQRAKSIESESKNLSLSPCFSKTSFFSHVAFGQLSSFVIYSLLIHRVDVFTLFIGGKGAHAILPTWKSEDTCGS